MHILYCIHQIFLSFNSCSNCFLTCSTELSNTLRQVSLSWGCATMRLSAISPAAEIKLIMAISAPACFDSIRLCILSTTSDILLASLSIHQQLFSHGIIITSYLLEYFDSKTIFGSIVAEMAISFLFILLIFYKINKTEKRRQNFIL
jgi:hypothetical protein